MNRRNFLAQSGSAAATALLAARHLLPLSHNISVQHAIDVRQVSKGRCHFFGYYDKCPWDSTGRLLDTNVHRPARRNRGTEPARSSVSIQRTSAIRDKSSWSTSSPSRRGVERLSFELTSISGRTCWRNTKGNSGSL